MSQSKSCDSKKLGRPGNCQESEYSGSIMSTRSRSVRKSLQPTFKQQGSMPDRCVHKFKGRDENLKLNKIPSQHHIRPCEAPSKNNMYGCETGKRSSNNPNLKRCGKSFDYSAQTDEMENNLADPTSRVSEPKCKREGRKRRVDLKCFQPTDWLSSIKPCKSPFYPQVGDEVMYFKQGMFI
jgi:hypothetical protein